MRDHQKIINSLLLAPNESEQSKIDQLMSELTELKKLWDGCDVEVVQRKMLKIQHARILSSNTLRLGNQLSEWQKANQFLYQMIQSHKVLSWGDIELFNSITSHGTGLRVRDIYSGDEAYMNLLEMKACLDYFQNKVLSQLESLGPIKAAATIRYWIVSLHPFDNGNGRTANLCADYF